MGSYKKDTLVFTDIALLGNLLYGIAQDLANGYLGIFDISYPTEPESLIFISAGEGFTPRSIHVTPDSIVYLADGYASVGNHLIFDSSQDIPNMEPIGLFRTMDFA